ncbi:type IV secretion system protein [Limnohabitans sp.]|uniref:type IV secretion system protein n=1 Tax=Limnohabitans sp. TaxID=1907725 RepID=UPI00286F0B2E|nr:type IV secretion system protein [Limnohabitans sp.]
MVDCTNLQNVVLGDVVSCMYNSVTGALSSKSTVLVDEGLDLAVMLLLITVSWAILMWMLSSDGLTALQESTKTFVRYSVVALMLSSWAAFTTGFFQTNFNQIAQKVAGTADVSTSANLMFQAAAQLFKGEQEPKCTQTAPVQVEAGVEPGYQQIDLCGAKGAPSITDMLLYFPKIMAALSFKIAALFFLALAFVAYVVAIFMAQVSFSIGVTLGPILVPWLIWERTEFLFDGWLKFMIAAGLTKIVAALMVATTAGMFVVLRGMADMIDSASGYSTVDLVAAWMMAIVSLICAYMMWQVQGIAQALVSGGSGASSKDFGKGAGRQAAGKAGSAAMSLGNFVASKVKGGTK